MAKNANTPLLDSVLGLAPSPEIPKQEIINTEPPPDPLLSAAGEDDLGEQRQREIEQQLEEEITSDEQSETEGLDGAPTNDNNGPVANNDRPVFNVIINGKLLLFMTDATIPKAMRWGMKKVGYETDKKLSDLMLTEAEKKALEPAADAVVEEIFKHMSPLTQFAVALVGVYGSKL